MNLNPFKKKKDPPNNERDVRELLRENLNVLNMDVFYKEDPLLSLPKEERLLYLKEFSNIYKSKIFMSRLRYMISKQAQKTLWNSGTGVQDISGAMEINGLASVIDELKRLANLHLKESAIPDVGPIDKFSIIPTVHQI